jgi:hypothetical protein
VALQISETVGGRTAVEKAMVLPIMDRAGAIHDAMLGELRLLVVRQRVYDAIREVGGQPS